MMQAGLIDEALNAVVQRATEALAFLGDYAFIAELWFGVAVLAFAAAYIAFFVPWQWVRGSLGALVAAAGIFAAGATTMFKRTREENKKLRDRLRAEELERRDRGFNEDTRPRGGWF